MDPEGFADLLAANRRYSISAPPNFDGIAHAGVGIVTCMDSRLQPLEMMGLVLGEAKILRTPGGHVTEDALRGLVLGVHLLRVTRILIVQHTRCAMAGGDDDWMRQRVEKATGADLTGFHIGADPNQLGRLQTDVEMVRTHPLITGRAQIGGFLYNVDTGLLEQQA